MKQKTDKGELRNRKHNDETQNRNNESYWLFAIHSSLQMGLWWHMRKQCKRLTEVSTRRHRNTSHTCGCGALHHRNAVFKSYSLLNSCFIRKKKQQQTRFAKALQINSNQNTHESRIQGRFGGRSIFWFNSIHLWMSCKWYERGDMRAAPLAHLASPQNGRPPKCGNDGKTKQTK